MTSLSPSKQEPRTAAEMQATYAAAHARLWSGKEPVATPKLPRPVSPFVREARASAAERRAALLAKAPAIGSPARRIVEEVARAHDLTVAELRGPSQKRYLSLARAEIYYRLTQETNLSICRIGRQMNRNHSSVLRSIRLHVASLADKAAKIWPSTWDAVRGQVWEWCEPAPYDACVVGKRQLSASVIDRVATKYGVTSDAIMSERRDQETVLARQEACYQLRRLSGLTLQEIGAAIGREYSTAAYSIRQHTKRMGKPG